MSITFDTLIQLKQDFYDILLANSGELHEDKRFPWPNYVFRSNFFRRAHLDIVDARDTKKLYMMHLCIFPNTNDSSPIYGFDIIAGPKKVTGAFHDFSAGYDKNHYMIDFFRNSVKGLEWSKKRELPEWARNIFSDSMVAAGNVQDPEELKTIANLGRANLLYYIEHAGKALDDTIDSTDTQNYYCYNQRQNPHTPKVMQSLGFDGPMVEDFIRQCLFPLVDDELDK